MSTAFEFFFFYVFAIAILEIIILGWKKSSVGLLCKNTRNNQLNWIFLVFQMPIIKSLYANVILLGMPWLISQGVNSIHTSGFHFWGSFGPVLGAIFATDFLSYWAHRLNHRWSLLWIGHEIHHSADEITIFTNELTHPIGIIISKVLISLPVSVLFELSPNEFLFVNSLFVFSDLVTHGRFDTDLGFLGNIFCSPRFHHLHHDREKVSGVNFGNLFSFWDRLFSTYDRPTRSIHDLSPGLLAGSYLELRPYKALTLPVFRFYREIFELISRFLRIAFLLRKHGVRSS